MYGYYFFLSWEKYLTSGAWKSAQCNFFNEQEPEDEHGKCSK